MIKLSKAIFSSSFSGLGNYVSKDGSRSIPATSIPAFGFVDFNLAIDMERGDSISQIQTRYTGIETVWRVFAGRHLVYKPTFASATDVFQIFASFSGDTLTITVRVQNGTASTKNSPAFTLDARVFLYAAPFAG